MPDPSPAIHAAETGTALDVEVTPGAASSRFPAGYNPWRRRLEVRVRAQAEHGAANDEVVRLVSAFFDVAERNVAITSGHTSRRKRIHVGYLPPDVATALVRRHVHSPRRATPPERTG